MISIYSRFVIVRFSIVLLVVIAVEHTSCSKSEEVVDAGAVASATTSPRVASCDRVAAMSYCAEYAGTYLSQNELALTGSCKQLGGTFVRAECPNTSVLGSCTLPTNEVRKLYASGGLAFDAARAKKECESAYHGTWKDIR